MVIMILLGVILFGVNKTVTDAANNPRQYRARPGMKLPVCLPQAGYPQRFRRANQPHLPTEIITGSVYFPREKVTKPSRFGIFTFRSVCASIVSLSAMMPLRFRI
jgi:hypothetical protein